MPTNRPVSLRPMFKKEEYKQFANTINKAMEINWFSWDNIIVSVLLVIAPPLVNWILVSVNTMLLFEFILIGFDYVGCC